MYFLNLKPQMKAERRLIKVWCQSGTKLIIRVYFKTEASGDLKKVNAMKQIVL